MAIFLNDILRFDSLENVKIRWNKQDPNEGRDFNPKELFKYNKEKLFLYHFGDYSNRKSYKQGEVVIGFANTEEDKWLLFDISAITKVNQSGENLYDHETCKEYEKYFGRVIVKKHIQQGEAMLIQNAEGKFDQIEVDRILDSEFDDGIFPGYDNVNVSWKELNNLVKKDSWKTALENQKGVYLITDIETNKRYVGSAYGKDMILGRWLDYLNDGHGGNAELKKLDFSYIQQNFRYSILDIYSSKTADEIIRNRERWWKETLLTHGKFGYNDN